MYFGKPIIYDEESGKPYPHYMYPNDARLRNMTYGVTIHYDIDVEYNYYDGDKKIQETKIYEKIYLGRFPDYPKTKLHDIPVDIDCLSHLNEL